MFILSGVKEPNNKTEQLNELCQTLVPGALNDTKKIRKAGADILANVGAEKPGNKLEKKMAEVSVSVPPSPHGVTKVTLRNKLTVAGANKTAFRSMRTGVCPSRTTFQSSWRPAFCPVARR